MADDRAGWERVMVGFLGTPVPQRAAESQMACSSPKQPGASPPASGRPGSYGRKPSTPRPMPLRAAAHFPAVGSVPAVPGHPVPSYLALRARSIWGLKVLVTFLAKI